MRAQYQPQLPPSPPPPPSPSPPLPQQPTTQSQQQLPQATCPICREDIEPNEAVIICSTCHQPCHRGEIIEWLTRRLADEYLPTCPVCRADMSWVLDNPSVHNTPPGLQPAELLLNINNWNWELGIELQ